MKLRLCTPTIALAVALSPESAHAKPVRAATAPTLKISVAGKPYKLVERDGEGFTFELEGKSKGHAPTLLLTQSPAEPASELPGYVAGTVNAALDRGARVHELRKVSGDGTSEDTVYVYTSLFPEDDTTKGQCSVSRIAYQEGRVFRVMLTQWFDHAKQGDAILATHSKLEKNLAAIRIPASAALAVVPEFRKEKP